MFKVLKRALLAAVPLLIGGGFAYAQASPFTLDVFGTPNWANTKPLHKFVDQLPGLGYANRNGLGQYIPVATKVDNPAFPNDDYYELGVVEFREQMHSELASTKLRGYVDLHASDPTGLQKPHYLGPLIIAKRDKPVRLKYVNQLPANSKLFLPIDTTLMGAGMGPLGMNVPNGLQMDYSPNRAEIHLHGGFTPWISDGTPHQWVTPTAESTPYRKGVGFNNVPDMVTGTEADNDATGTLYYTNQQSGRLMFYHDHSYGTTRLNVYGGEAAGYLLVDPTEDTLINNSVIPGKGMGVYQYGIPLIIQDKTFVTTTASDPNRNTVVTDPTWPMAVPGSQDGDLWFPHVYTPNQDPASPDGMNPFGRWDYGPWFWPPWTVDPGKEQVPQISAVPEGFMDTPIVNGTAYPYLNVQPQAYRFRILNACNDRMLNLQLYQADGTGGSGATATATMTAGSITALTLGSGGSGYSFAPGVYITGGGGFGAAATTTITGGVVTAITITNPGWGYTSTPTVTIGMASEVKMVPAVANATPNWPATWPTDGRDGGVPDPNAAGPSMVQIGSEGGLLPAPVVLPNTPVGYNYNRRDIVVLNVANHTLWLGPAERADIIVDFSQYAGKTVILYNDMAAPVPAFDPRFDYYTFDPDWSYTATDLTGSYSGGAATTQPGFGPNTRTIMQFRVANTTPATTFNPAAPAFVSAMTAAYAASQPPPLIPQNTYPAPNQAVTNTYARISDTSLTYSNLGAQTLQSISVTSAGRLYTVPPTVTISGGGGTGATATATIATTGTLKGQVTGVTLINHGSGFTSAPSVTFTSNDPGTPKGSGATAIAITSKTVTINFQPKCIQELFDTWGRMNATLGTEVPNTNGTNQTTIPLGYVDPETETVPDGQVQIWKITHNGVDTHAIHWHLVNVQVINRVGWDGAIRPPEPTELGWKETVKMNPLEDIIVAVKPAAPARLPFGIPDSVRLLDPTMPANSTFNSLDPLTGGAVTVTNQMTNFGWEYVWHCHLLGHEENDMMRPFSMTEPFVTRPSAPTNLTASLSGFSVNLAWTRHATASNPEWGFRIERNQSGTTVWALVDVAPAGATTYTDATAAALTGYTYRVRSVNKAGISSPSNVRTVNTPAARPVTLATITPAANANGWNNTDVSVTLNSTSPVGTTIASLLYEIDGNPWVTLTATTTTTFAVTGNAQHIVQFYAVDNLGHVEPTNIRHINIDTTAPVTTETVGPTPNVAGWNNTNVSVTLTGTDNVAAVTYSVDGGAPTAVGGSTATFSITTEGVHTISAFSTDLAGNVEMPNKTWTVSIDKTAPTTTCTLNGTTATLAATDTLSGVYLVNYRLDNGALQLYTAPIAYDLLPHSLVYYATDVAGNVEAQKTTLITDRRAATVMYSAPASARAGDTATLYAYLWAAGSYAPISGRTIHFLVAGVEVGTGVTGASGYAQCAYTLPSNATGTYPITAAFTDTTDPSYGVSSAASTLSITAKAPTLMYASSSVAAAGGTTTLYAYLWTTGGVGISGKTIHFFVGGVEVGTGTTDANGFALMAYTLPQNASGAYTITAAFNDATDPAYLTSSASGTLTVSAKAPTQMYSANVTGKAGLPATLYAYLWTSNGTVAVSGKTIHFLVAGTEVGTGTTNGAGYAQFICTLPITPGPYPITAAFTDTTDPVYMTGSAASTLTVTP